jgi:ubiquinone/menaquinone biosynthesis C-methylase UbiE
MLRTRYSYDRYAWCYESIARVFSLGAIPRVKASQVAALGPVERVLYVGVGAGEDALLAARRGVDLTCLDLSQPMLRRLTARLDGAGLKARLVCEDVLEHMTDAPYDVVVANFVLNVFSQDTLVVVMRHLASLLVPGGRLLIADFTPPGRSPMRRLLYGAYYFPINWIAWALGLCALHPIYDYAHYVEAAGLRLVARSSWPIWPKGWGAEGPRLFESLSLERPLDAVASEVSQPGKAG